MHLYFITRGCKHEVDRFITELQGKYMPIEYEKGKQGSVAMGVRPIQLWELVFPEPELNTVIATIQPGRYQAWTDKFASILRKMLHCESVPEIKPGELPFPIYRHHMEVLPIGIKKDNYIDGIEQL